MEPMPQQVEYPVCFSIFLTHHREKHTEAVNNCSQADKVRRLPKPSFWCCLMIPTQVHLTRIYGSHLANVRQKSNPTS